MMAQPIEPADDAEVADDVGDVGCDDAGPAPKVSKLESRCEARDGVGMELARKVVKQ